MTKPTTIEELWDTLAARIGLAEETVTHNINGPTSDKLNEIERKFDVLNAKLDELLARKASDHDEDDEDDEDEILTSEESKLARKAKKGLALKEKKAIDEAVNELVKAREKLQQAKRKLRKEGLTSKQRHDIRSEIQDAEEEVEEAEEAFSNLVEGEEEEEVVLAKRSKKPEGEKKPWRLTW